jgi:hypothetical protein
VPDPLSIIRLAALLIFIGLVALGLWLLDVAWWVVPPVMGLALLIAWTLEWLAWQGSFAGVARGTTAVGPAPPPAPSAEEEPPPPVETIAPMPSPAPPPATAPPPMPKAEEPAPPQPEQEAQPEPEPVGAPAAPAPPPPTPVEPPAPPEPVAKEPAPPAPEPEKRPRRPRRMRLRPVPALRPAPSPPPARSEASESPVVALRPRTTAPRSWNLWDLERIAREGVRTEPERRDEWAYLFLHLRQFAAADGSLPTEFDGLVRESFGGLLERAPGA